MIARAFHMTAEDAKSDDEVILGTVLVIDFPVIVLFDAGASISFVSRMFCAQFVIPRNPLRPMLYIEVAVGTYVQVQENMMGIRSSSLVTPFL